MVWLITANTSMKDWLHQQVFLDKDSISRTCTTARNPQAHLALKIKPFKRWSARKHSPFFTSFTMKSANLSTWPEVLEEMTQNKECDSCHQTAPGLCDPSGQTFIQVKSFKNCRLTPASDYRVKLSSITSQKIWSVGSINNLNLKMCHKDDT